MPPEKDFPVSWATLGKTNQAGLRLREIGIINGNSAKEKLRVIEAGERMFTDDIVDEWVSLDGRSEAITEYDENHLENSLKCTYGKTIAEANNETKNVILLISLPVKKPITCLLVRRNIDPTHEISCKVK